MKVRDRLAALAVMAVSLGTAGTSDAQRENPAASAAVAQASEGPSDRGGDGDALPTGHPPVEPTNPHARASGNSGMPGMFQPPEDVEQADPTLSAGSISVDLHDPDDKPVAHESVTVGILINSVAKGDSRKHLQKDTDDRGHCVFSDLDTASNIAYRVSVGYQGGSFAAAPFQLGQVKAMHVLLHVYPVTRDLESTLIVSEAAIGAELRDDRVQVEESLTIYNLGRTAWQPDGVTMSLPGTFTAFNAQASMSDQGVDEIEGQGARMHGTFSPGQHVVQFRWQIPWSGDKDVDFELGLPPHVAIARVVMPASSGIKLTAAGFPPAELVHDSRGQSFLVTERRLRPADPRIRSLDIGIHDLPTPGPGRFVATLLAALGVGVGIFFVARGGRRRAPIEAPERARDALLEEIAALEEALASGEVGPRTYETARRELIDLLALALNPV
ncbi:MAG: hypothetical protein ABSF69_00560 [Polyangiaceae bacterium]|jgi:hypothetical protein